MPQHSEELQANTASQRFSNQHQAPSIKYEEIEGPNPKLLYQARAPPHPVLPRKRLSAHNNVLLQTLRERYPLTASLTGPARAGKAGELSCAGGFYRGEVLAGQPHGKGQFFTMLLGGRGPRLQYDGQWWQGRREGKGTRFYFNGETYSGMWLANQRHGLGRMEYTNGDAYEGTWERDIRQGPATYFYGNGDIFVGRYVRDRREGLGTIYMPRKRQKHVAEYVADRPLCGSWAELDDAALAPLSGYLRAALAAAESVEAEMEHHQLPQLAIRSPNKMLGEQIDVLRKTAGGRAQLLHAVSAKMSTFEAAEVERLQHAFVRLGGGDARKARVTEDRLTEVCTAAGLQPGQERTLKLCSQLLEGVKQDGKLDFEDFISVVYFKEVDELLSAYGVHPDGHKD